MTGLSRLAGGDWRAFTREIAIVVIGVLVALGADDVADGWKWQRKLEAGEDALRREAAFNFTYAAEQVVVGPCIQAQVDAARDRVLASGATLLPAPVFHEPSHDFVYRLPSRVYVDSAWQALNSDGTTGYMVGARRGSYASFYRQVRDLGFRRDEIDVVTSRLLLLGRAIPLDSATRANLAGDLMQVGGQSRRQTLVAGQIMASMRDLGIAPRAADVDAELADTSGTMEFCKAHGLPLADWKQQLATLRPPPTK